MKPGRHSSLFDLLNLGAFLKRCPKDFIEIAKLKSAVYYLRLIRGIRSGYVVFFQILFSMLFIIFGMIFMHAALVIFLMGGPHRLVWIFLIAGVLELGSVGAFIAWFLSSKRWLEEAARINPDIEKLLLVENQSRL